MHSAYALGWSEPEVRDQEVEINAEIPGGGYSAAGRGVAKPFDTSLQSIHDLTLTFQDPRLTVRTLRSSSTSGPWRPKATQLIRQVLVPGFSGIEASWVPDQVYGESIGIGLK